MYHSLTDYINVLEAHDELLRIKEYVDPKLEIAEITDRVSKESGGGKAILFENTGYSFPVLMNAMGSYKRICLALGVNDLDDVAHDIEGLFKTLMKPKDNIMEKLRMLPTLGQLASFMPKSLKGRGSCQEVVMAEPDITKLPVITCWPHDGGPFVTLPVINTKDPHTGIRNVGMYRMQVFGPTLTGMHWHKHKVSARHFNAYKEIGIKMPVAVALGGDPVYTYAATAPLPDNVDEYMLAGFLRKKKVELVKCLTQDIEVPADADIIIEGYVDPVDELIWEGPFGDHTGYYSLADYYPRFHITCITHKKNAVYPATIVGIPPQEDAWLGKATERIFLAPIKMTMVPEIIDMELPIEGVFHNLTIVKIDKTFSGQGQKVMNAMWGAGQMMFNKMLVITDKKVDIANYLEVARAISTNVDPANDIYLTQGPMDVLDHACSKFAFGGKMSIDASIKTDEEINDAHTLVTEPIDIAFIATETERIRNAYKEIHDINTGLLMEGVSCILISVEKSRPHHVRELSEQLFNEALFKKVKFVIVVEHTVRTGDIKDVIWRWSNNLDPKRDSFVFMSKSPDEPNHIAFDGTRKTKKFDGFNRPWPNIIAASPETIAAIDTKWNSLGIGKLIVSPSLKYQSMLYKGGATVEE